MTDSPEQPKPEVVYSPEEAGKILAREKNLVNYAQSTQKWVELSEGALRTDTHNGPEVAFIPNNPDLLGTGRVYVRRERVQPDDEMGKFWKQAGGIVLSCGVFTDQNSYPLITSYLRSRQRSTQVWEGYFIAAFGTYYITDGRQIKKFCRYPRGVPLPESYQVARSIGGGLGYHGSVMVERPVEKVDIDRINRSLDLLEKIQQ